MNNDDLLKSDITHESIDHFSTLFAQHYATLWVLGVQSSNSVGGWAAMVMAASDSHGCNEEKHHG